MSHRLHHSVYMKLSAECKIGDVVEIESSTDRNNLPTGLTPGFQVRIIRIEADLRIVEREGREWCLRGSQIRARGRPIPSRAAPCSAPPVGRQVTR